MEEFKISCDQLEGGMPRISVDFRRVKMCVVWLERWWCLVQWCFRRVYDMFKGTFCNNVVNAFQDVNYTLISMKSVLGWVGPCLIYSYLLGWGLRPVICFVLGSMTQTLLSLTAADSGLRDLIQISLVDRPAVPIVDLQFRPAEEARAKKI